MMNEHVSDEELQLFALSPDAVGAGVSKHIGACAVCKESADAYRFIMGAITDDPRPAFDFDLSAQVLKQLPAGSARVSNSLPAWIWILIPFLMAVPMYFFRTNFENFFKGVSILVVCSLGVAAFIILVFRIYEIYYRYQRKMEILNIR